MEYSVREAKAHFSAAIAAVERGERVTVTKYGKPVATIVPIEPSVQIGWARAMEIRKELGITDNDTQWFDDFVSNPEASRRVLGLDD